MGVEVLQVNAQSMRETVINLLWEHRHRRETTLEQYTRAWDWRYTALADGDPIAWIARDTDTQLIVGYIAVYPRRFRIGGTDIRAGVPGNLMVHPDYRTGFVGPRLVAAPRTLVKNGTLDMAIAFANEAAHPLFLKLGFHDLGRMHSYTDVRRWGPPLRRRMKASAPLGPVLDGVFSARRWLHRRRHGVRTPGLTVRRMNGEQFLGSARSHWLRPDDRLVADNSGSYVTRRFIECPLEERRLFGIVDDATGALEGYVILEGTSWVRVWECQVNRARLDEATAIALVTDVLDDTEIIQVPLLPGSILADELRSMGFFPRKSTDYVETTTGISAYWLPSHPLAKDLADTRRWNVWFGWNHY